MMNSDRAIKIGWALKVTSKCCANHLFWCPKRGKKLKPHILALLESDENSNQVVESLTGVDQRTTVCKKFTKAIKILEEKSCALIISDVHLENGGNVFDFLRWAKANPRTKDTPFVLLSCKPTKMAKYVEDGVRTTASLLGADLYLTYENFDPVSFRNQIEPLLLVDGQKQKTTRKTMSVNINNDQSNHHKENEWEKWQPKF